MGVYTCYPVRYMNLIQQHAGRLDAAFICAVIHTESKFRTEVRSNKGAAGLMQITEPTALWMATEMDLNHYNSNRIYEPEVNIAIGCFFLNWLMDYYDNDITLVLCAYNAGIGNVNRWLSDKRYSSDGKTLSDIPFQETEQYVVRVENNQRIYNLLLPLHAVFIKD